MSRLNLIDKDALHFKIADWQLILSETYGINDEYVRCLEDVLGMVDNAPTIDAVEVKHGSWEKAKPHGVVIYSNAYAECSSCHSVIYLGWEMKYCPNCGAKMDGEVK